MAPGGPRTRGRGDRRLAVLFILGITVALAGCSALPVWDDGSGPTATPSPSPTDAVPEPDPTGEAGRGPTDVAYPDGYGPGGVRDPEVAVSSHVTAMTEYGSYIFSYDSRIEGEGGSAGIAFRQLANHSTRRAYQVRDTGSVSIVRYYEGDAVYTRREADGEVTFDSTNVSFEMTAFTGFQFVRPLLANVTYRDAEVFRTANGTYFRYVSERVTNASAILRTDVDESRIESFAVGIVVDETGAVRRALFTVRADRTITVDMRVGELGTTELTRPEWFDRAADAD